MFASQERRNQQHERNRGYKHAKKGAESVLGVIGRSEQHGFDAMFLFYPTQNSISLFSGEVFHQICISALCDLFKV